MKTTIALLCILSGAHAFAPAVLPAQSTVLAATQKQSAAEWAKTDMIGVVAAATIFSFQTAQPALAVDSTAFCKLVFSV